MCLINLSPQLQGLLVIVLSLPKPPPGSGDISQSVTAHRKAPGYPCLINPEFLVKLPPQFLGLLVIVLGLVQIPLIHREIPQAFIAVRKSSPIPF